MRNRISPMAPKMAFCLALSVVTGARAGLAARDESGDLPGTAVGQPALRVGAAVVDIAPPAFPVIVNGYTLERTANKVHDRLTARAMVFDDGRCRVAVVVVDSCVLPASLVERAKEWARRSTGIVPERILVSATHTHSAPSVMAALGSREDRAYSEFLPGRIATAIEQACAKLAPARAGWITAAAPEHTHCRLWIMQPGKVPLTSFNEPGKRILMCPPYASPESIGPAGPVDAALTLLAFQTPDGRPLAVLANYGMHFYGAPVLSADWCGAFDDLLAARLGGKDRAPVVIMSQGTAGDQHYMDFSRPAVKSDYRTYAEGLVDLAQTAHRKIVYQDRIDLAMRQTTLTLGVRRPPRARLEWAKSIVGQMGNRAPETSAEVYAREQILFSRTPPTRQVILQALRVGELGITAVPCEVYGITGLKIKARSPLATTMNIELANGEEGYLPPPEQHSLGGYSTWEARTSCLEVQAEPKIVEAVLGLLEEVAGRPRRAFRPPDSAYCRAVLASKPVAYWRLHDMAGPTARDALGRCDGGYEPQIAFYSEGPRLGGLGPEDTIGRAAHFAGGRMKATASRLGSTYSIECWLWNGLPADFRPETSCFFSRATANGNAKPIVADHLGIGGAAVGSGRLVFYGADRPNQSFQGKAFLPLKTWKHVVLVRDGRHVAVYLDGNPNPDIQAETQIACPADADRVFLGGRGDGLENLEGKLSEVSLYDRALAVEEIRTHWRSAHLSLR